MKKKTYFISDIHLGLPNAKGSLKRERLLVKFLDEIKPEAKTIFFVGDIFDFWWEYKSVVPRGFVRFLGKIAELTDSGIDIHFFVGNHDIWMKSYLPEETGIILHHSGKEFVIDNKKLFIAHGDGLGPGDKTYKILRKIFTNKFLQWWYNRLHPNLAFAIARKWSHSRSMNQKTIKFQGKDKEFMYLYAKESLKRKHTDYFIFGHRHVPVLINMNESSKYVNLGDWILHFSYGVFDGNKFKLRTYKNSKQEDLIPDINAEYKTLSFRNGDF